MKLILENWRKYLDVGIHPKIQNTLDSLNDKIHVEIKQQGARIFIRYVLESGKSLEKELGQVSMMRNYNEQYGACLNDEEGQVFSIQKTFAEAGFGVILYEIAIEWASQNGSGLVADRYEVSDDALAVWEKYITRGDVKKDQLDIDKEPFYNPDGYPQLNDDPKDDCYQKSAISSKGEKWHESPLSLLYSKDNTEVMDYFEQAGRLKVTGS